MRERRRVVTHRTMAQALRWALRNDCAVLWKGHNGRWHAVKNRDCTPRDAVETHYVQTVKRTCFDAGMEEL